MSKPTLVYVYKIHINIALNRGFSLIALIANLRDYKISIYLNRAAGNISLINIITIWQPCWMSSIYGWRLMSKATHFVVFKIWHPYYMHFLLAYLYMFVCVWGKQASRLPAASPHQASCLYAQPARVCRLQGTDIVVLLLKWSLLGHFTETEHDWFTCCICGINYPGQCYLLGAHCFFPV